MKPLETLWAILSVLIVAGIFSICVLRLTEGAAIDTVQDNPQDQQREEQQP